MKSERDGGRAVDRGKERMKSERDGGTRRRVDRTIKRAGRWRDEGARQWTKRARKADTLNICPPETDLGSEL